MCRYTTYTVPPHRMVGSTAYVHTIALLTVACGLTRYSYSQGSHVSCCHVWESPAEAMWAICICVCLHTVALGTIAILLAVSCGAHQLVPQALAEALVPACWCHAGNGPAR